MQRCCVEEVVMRVSWSIQVNCKNISAMSVISKEAIKWGRNPSRLPCLISENVWILPMSSTFFSCNRLLVMLSLHRRQSNSHQFRRYDLVWCYYTNYYNNVLFIVGLWRENNQSIILLESEREIASKGVRWSQSFKGCITLLSR